MVHFLIVGTTSLVRIFVRPCVGSFQSGLVRILGHGLQSISRDAADNVSHLRRLDPTKELTTYYFVLYLQHGRCGINCKPSIGTTRPRKRFQNWSNTLELTCSLQLTISSIIVRHSDQQTLINMKRPLEVF